MAEKSTMDCWIQVAAGLKNPAMRQALAEALGTGAPVEPRDKKHAKELERWQATGLLMRSDAGVVLNEQLLLQTLQAAGRGAEERTGIQRFFAGPRLHTLPASPADRHAVMLCIRDAVITPGEQLHEPQLNERLRTVHPDVALLRRYLVDHQLLARTVDGASYTRPAGS